MTISRANAMSVLRKWAEERTLVSALLVAADSGFSVKVTGFLGSSSDDRFDHFDEQLDHTSWRVKLAALLAFCAGELAQEVFIHAPEDVFGATLFVAES